LLRLAQALAAAEDTVDTALPPRGRAARARRLQQLLSGA
jgi:hypothetical protein